MIQENQKFYAISESQRNAIVEVIKNELVMAKAEGIVYILNSLKELTITKEPLKNDALTPSEKLEEAVAN